MNPNMNTLIRFRQLILCALICTTVVFPGTATAGIAAAIPDYDLLDGVLLRGVRNGFVDYDSIRQDPGFKKFVTQIKATDENSLQDIREKLAFYINAYNALAIQGILAGRSPDSAWGRFRFFRTTRYTVHGNRMSLSGLEKTYLKAIGDPRIHFAIVCASISCPRISNRAYQAETVDEDLNAAAARFINDPSRNSFDLGRKTAYVSKIFAWYQQEFETSAGSVQAYLAKFIDDAEIAAALENDEFVLKFEKYDWSLNGSLSETG